MEEEDEYDDEDEDEDDDDDRFCQFPDESPVPSECGEPPHHYLTILYSTRLT